MVAEVEAQRREVYLEHPSHHGATFDDETGRSCLHRIKEALDGELVRSQAIFLDQSDSIHNSLALRVDAAEEDDVASESSLLQSLV